MSGHSKWATIKRAKGAADAKRGQVFTKMGREIVSAVREGGPNPESNFRLRLIIDKAKQVNMPKDNIERAIERASGGDKGASLEEMLYEGYGPSGTALLVSVLTDNRNRTIAEVRRIFTRSGANLGESGCVAWMFDHKGYLTIVPKNGDAEDLALSAIDAGAEDVKISDEYVEVYTAMPDFQTVKEALEANGIEPESAELSWIPKTTMDLSEEETIKNLRLIDALEELDDVLNVYSNLNVSDEIIEKYSQEG
ncbi:MAG: YebC/PmpR family DNA-binding transcriptional regulator [Chloroflexi bacterium]|nr:YebC/PmpR family DNA-binding transcriptional regulator [Chloroflexota bacterium]